VRRPNGDCDHVVRRQMATFSTGKGDFPCLPTYRLSSGDVPRVFFKHEGGPPTRPCRKKEFLQPRGGKGKQNQGAGNGIERFFDGATVNRVEGVQQDWQRGKIQVLTTGKDIHAGTTWKRKWQQFQGICGSAQTRNRVSGL